MFKGLSDDFFNFFVVFGHDDFTVVVYELNDLINWEGDAIAFELFKDFVDFFPVEPGLDIGLGVEAEEELVDSFQSGDDEDGFDQRDGLFVTRGEDQYLDFV